MRTTSRRWVKLFQLQFVSKVSTGAKPSTIRPLPKRPQDWPQVGDLIDARHWSGKAYRSHQVQIMTARITRVRRVEILANELRFAEPNGELVSAWNASEFTGAQMLESVAARDGFECWHHMATWFNATHGLPFAGILIEWDRATISRGSACADDLRTASPAPNVSTGVGGALPPDGEYLAGVLDEHGHAVATRVRVGGGRILDASGARVRISEISWLNPDQKDREIAKLRSEIDRLRSENEEIDAEITSMTRNPPEVRCAELTEMVFQSQQRNQRLSDQIAELKTAGRALDARLRSLGHLRTATQLSWRRVLRKKPSDYQQTQPATPSH